MSDIQREHLALLDRAIEEMIERDKIYSDRCVITDSINELERFHDIFHNEILDLYHELDEFDKQYDLK